MNIRLILVAILTSATISAFAGDEAKNTEPLEARLQAIENQLTRIETLLSASVPASNLPEVASGQFRVTILGQVSRPGVYAVDPETPLVTLAALAGGYTRLAKQTEIAIVSKNGEKLTVDASKDLLAYKLQKGDIVTVPERFY